MQASAGFVSASALGMACGPALAWLYYVNYKLMKKVNHYAQQIQVIQAQRTIQCPLIVAKGKSRLCYSVGVIISVIIF
ncbi:hypothetical protein PanWU01x14_226970 [Parasponia andersonii]|uniref:Uncharacterized protein n=1 Tax=Parasponia andersonii TaxID=3476 RepID=A0A2P5BM61_PARAD|nr:hypothetical protein PanWU01x14_226970 [Parasponia andersonii]